MSEIAASRPAGESRAVAEDHDVFNHMVLEVLADRDTRTNRVVAACLVDVDDIMLQTVAPRGAKERLMVAEDHGDIGNLAKEATTWAVENTKVMTEDRGGVDNLGKAAATQVKEVARETPLDHGDVDNHTAKSGNYCNEDTGLGEDPYVR